MPEQQPSEEREAVIGEKVPVQVADEPPLGGVRLKPAQEVHHLSVRQVMGELGRDDEVEFPRRHIGEGIAVDEIDARRRVRCLHRRSRRPRV